MATLEAEELDQVRHFSIAAEAGARYSSQVMPRPEMNPISWHALHVAVPLLLGGVIYLAWRTQALLMFEWAEWAKCGRAVAVLRQNLGPFAEGAPDWVRYSLPDAAWVYAFTAQLRFLWRRPVSGGWFWLVMPLMLGVGGEIGQGLGFVPGTFDAVDALLCTAAWLVAMGSVRPANPVEGGWSHEEGCA